MAAGILAGSIALTGFGLDSFVESLSGGIMIWRFTKHGTLEEEEKKEKRAIKLVAISFFLLGIYILFESVKKLYLSEAPSPSLLGIIIAIVSLITMPILFYVKNRTARTIKSESMIADSKQTLACMFLSLALLIGLGLNYFFGYWHADPIIGLIIFIFLIKEGYGVYRKGKVCSC